VLPHLLNSLLDLQLDGKANEFRVLFDQVLDAALPEIGDIIFRDEKYE